MTRKNHTNAAPHARRPEDCPEPTMATVNCGEGAVMFISGLGHSAGCECGFMGPYRATRDEARADLDGHRQEKAGRR